MWEFLSVRRLWYEQTKETGLLWGVFAVYLALRLLAWNNSPLLEDNDSTSYLAKVRIFLTFDLHRIIDLDPSSTPFYPFFSSLFSLPIGSVETGARLCSLFFMCILFVAVAGIGRRLSGTPGVIAGLVILTFNPYFVRLSYSVLSEPSYVAVVYLGLWLLILQYQQPKLWWGALLGVIFGLSFLNRVEGVLFLAMVPVLQLIHFATARERRYSFRSLVLWAASFITVFSLVSAPQVWRVSEKMGAFYLNGRQAWSIMSNRGVKIYGLDYSPGQINLRYLYQHPKELASLQSKEKPLHLLKLVAFNFDDFYQNKLGRLVGPLVLIFFGFGLLALYRDGYRFKIFIVIAFLLTGITAPLLFNVALRHILVIGPMIMLIAGIGVIFLSRTLVDGMPRVFANPTTLMSLFLLILITVWARPLSQIYFRPDAINDEYRPTDLRMPVAIVAKFAKENSKPTIVAARKGYLPYFTNTTYLPVPYTDYHSLVRYLSLNDADFLFLEYRAKSWPFLDEFSDEASPPHFQSLYRGTDWRGRKLELYRFLPANMNRTTAHPQDQ